MNHHTAVPTARSTDAPGLQRLRRALGDRPLQPLEPAEYARGHALFETRSDQRSRLTDWLIEHLAARACAPTRVLSIGCGDGAVDVRLAAALAAQGHDVDYVGVEPHRDSGEAFLARLDGFPHVAATLVTADFVDARPSGAFDVVVAVHSLYYVADLASTLRRALALLAPGGELIVLLAPREPLNALVDVLAPGRPQIFSEDFAHLVRDLDRRAGVTTIDARLDLRATADADAHRRLLEFTVQALLPDALLAPVRAALAERAVPGPGLVLPHPVDAFVLPA